MCGGIKQREEIKAGVSESCTSLFSLERMRKNSEENGERKKERQRRMERGSSREVERRLSPL